MKDGKGETKEVCDSGGENEEEVQKRRRRSVCQSHTVTSDNWSSRGENALLHKERIPAGCARIHAYAHTYKHARTRAHTVRLQELVGAGSSFQQSNDGF